jgi:hypothetical protein
VRLPSGGNPCSYSISPGSSFFDAVGGTGSVNVNTPGGCGWSALSVSDFLSITSKANGAGNATIRFAVPVNELPSNSLRTGALIVADQTHTVVQAIIPSIFGRDNDTMTSALTISNLPFAYALDTRSATADPNDPVHTCTGLTDSKTVWLQFTPTFTGNVLARAKGYRYGVFANPGTVLSAYSGTTELDCDKSIGGPPSASQIRFDVTAGQIYFIEVSGNGRANPGGYIAFSLVKSSPKVEIAVASLDFGSVSVGQSADRKFTLKSTGNVPLTASLATGSPQFTIVAPAAGFTVASGDQQQITMRFTPAGTGAQPSTLTISSNDAAHPSISVALTGTGVVLSPAIDLAPLVLGFGTVNTGDTQDQPLVLTNTGKGALTIRSISSTDPQFTVSAPDVPFTLPPSAQQMLTIHFTPAASGTQTATLSISSDDPNHPVASVVLTGIGN